MPDSTPTNAVGGGSVRNGLIDGDDLIELTTRLHAARQRIAEAAESDSHRRRWERRLATVSETGTRNLRRALEQMDELEADLVRLEDVQR